tara:strand:+ start:38 stop:478 length:441 start_codon:yes stop_codon:yes gene_type:complete
MIKTKKDAFAKYGIVQDNERWSWSGINTDITPPIDPNLALPLCVMTIWTDQRKFDKEKRQYEWSIFNAENEIWRDSLGNKKRIEHIKFCLDKLDGKFKAIFVEPINSGIYDETRSIKKITVNHKISFKITEFDEKTGECSAIGKMD